MVCALPVIELENGCGRGWGRGRWRRPNRLNEHPEIREKEVVVLNGEIGVANAQILVDQKIYQTHKSNK